MNNQKTLIGNLFIIGILFLSLTCSKSTGVDDDDDIDRTPPSAIANLTVIAVTTSSATIQWTAPGDDDTVGCSIEYDMRGSYDSITALNFEQAYKFDEPPAPLPFGLVHQYVVDGLEPDSTYYFAIKTRDDAGNWSGISNCPHVHIPGIAQVVFADTALERVVREHINKPTGDILSSDVDTVIQIIAEGLGISSLSGLEYFTSLQNILMMNNDISDLTPLGGLTQLWGVHVSVNNISDISPLAGNTTITQLHLGQNPITDIGPTATMTSLEQLVLTETAVTDFSPLYGLPHLSDILFNSCNLTDVSFVSNLTHLRIAVISFNQISSLAPFSGLTALEALGLDYNQISDIGPLAGLVNLKYLYLRHNQISDIQPLVNNSGIGSGDEVYLNNNPLSPQSVDTLIPALEARGVTVSH